MLFETSMARQYLQPNHQQGIIGDWCQPNFIRLAPPLLYNTFEEVGQVFHFRVLKADLQTASGLA